MPQHWDMDRIMAKTGCKNDAVYLDYNATTPIAPEVIATMKQAMEEAWGNPSSNHRIGKCAKGWIDQSRILVGRMVQLADTSNVIFTSGGTEANNMAIHSAVTERRDLPKGKLPHVIASSVEHDSVMKYLKHLERWGLIELSIAAVNPFDAPAVFESTVMSLITDNTCFITVMHSNNESGIIMPVGEIGMKLGTINADRSTQDLPYIYLHTDAAQTVGKIEVSMAALGVDYLTIVGHKFYGPRIGALCISNNNVPVIPLLHGGSQENGHRPGTENTVMIAGMGKACALVTSQLSQQQKHMSEMRTKLENGLKTIPGVEINFEKSRWPLLPNTLSVRISPGMTGADVLNKCQVVNESHWNSEGIHIPCFYASLGAACHSDSNKSLPSYILLAHGLTPDEARRTVRFSVGRTTTAEEILLVVSAMELACQPK